jgi:hypothetical protein
MTSVNRLARHYDWTPVYRTVFKKPAPLGRKLFSVPQTIGQSGWIILTYETQRPVCYWVTQRETKQIPCCVDERLCGDTFLRCEKIRNDFIVSDIFIYNSNRVFNCSTFEQRYTWLKELLTFFKQIPGFPRFVHKSALETHHTIRGQESYTDEIGAPGFYSEDVGQLVKIKKNILPDCYMIEDSYLRVPSLTTSKYLRSLGDEFELRCVRNEDGSWSLV